MNSLTRAALMLIAGLTCLGLPSRAAEATTTATSRVAQALEIPGVHNAFRATEKIYSGSQPEGDAAFAALAKLGIKTIISVDGSKPDIEAARKHGLRYIHLPYGYDGVPTNRIVELTKAATSEGGPFFVHCHHGKHRGPAAVAVMCEATAGWTTNRAEAWLREAGTASDYPGLYRAAREFRMPTAAALAAVKELPEVAQSSSLVDSMVAFDAHFEHLKLAQKAGWKQPPGHADISPAHEATLLWEQFRELARLNDTMKRPEDYRSKLTEAEQLSETLRQQLRTSADASLINATFKKIGQNCVSCHKAYRNQ